MEVVELDCFSDLLELSRIASVTVVCGVFEELEMFSFTLETKLSILEFPVLELFVVVVVFFVEELDVICCVKACAPALSLLLVELEELVLFVVVVLFEP